MWRARFYEESWLGRWIYKPVVGGGWLVLLAFSGYNHVSTGVPWPPGLAILLGGFALFLAAKVLVIRRGIWLTVGTEKMRPVETLLYLSGYALMIGGFVLSFD
jgi:hypothetical protein